jgi:hypothetical protein
MPTSIYKYKKQQNAWTEIVMRFPDSAGSNDELHCTELCTIDADTYVAVPDDMTLPEQPPEIKIEKVTLTPELKAAIRASSVHSQFIDDRRQQLIRSRYSLDDEQYMTRLGLKQSLGLEQMTADQKLRLREYDAYVEECLLWAKQQRASLGL